MKLTFVTFARIATLAIAPCLGTLAAVAQNNSAGNAAGGVGVAACCSTFIAIPIVIVVLNIVLLVWVARDAKSRGMDSSILWMALVFFTSVIGLVIYLFSRPQGAMIECPNCRNKKLQAAVRCPHCGFGS